MFCAGRSGEPDEEGTETASVLDEEEVEGITPPRDGQVNEAKEDRWAAKELRN